jgi:hypothetical protein
MELKPEGTLKRPWTTPTAKTIDLRSAPYAEVIDILRIVLRHAEKDVSVNPGDEKAADLERALRRTLADLESDRENRAASGSMQPETAPHRARAADLLRSFLGGQGKNG